MNLAVNSRRGPSNGAKREKAGVGTVARYARPRSLDEALGLMAEGRWRVLAGGTDFYPALGAAPLPGFYLLLSVAVIGSMLRRRTK